MNSYKLYEKVLESLNGDEGTFNAAARNWIEGSETVDFKNDEANTLFHAAKIACAAWRNKAINGRISKTKMVNCVRAIAEKHLPNPYDPNEPDPTEVKPVEVKEEPKKHIFGVIPVKEEVKAEEEVQPEEKKEEKAFFSKRKKR